MPDKFKYTSTDDIRRKRDELNAELDRRKMGERKSGVIELLNDEDNIITQIEIRRPQAKRVDVGSGQFKSMRGNGKTVIIDINGGSE